MNINWSVVSELLRMQGYTDDQIKESMERITWKSKNETGTYYYNDSINRGRAASAVQRALKKNEISKQPCDRCGSQKVVAHHHVSYKKEDWLNIIWLCRRCHYDWHSYFGSVD